MECPNGHTVAETQKFCPECGTAVTTDPAPHHETPAAAGPDTRRPVVSAKAALILAGGLFAALLATIAVVALVGNNDSETVSADTASAGTASPPPSDPSANAVTACVQQTAAFLNAAATATNSGDEAFLFRRYGTEDPRTYELSSISTTFQAEVIQYGEQRANDLLTDRLRTYCEDYELGSGTASNSLPAPDEPDEP